jgi:hypothetical protein
MSFHFHPGAYEQTTIKHAELVAQAEIERRLRAAAEQGPSLINRLRCACGHWLIAAGERLARPVAATARA